jgi:Domain of unknown function (DUF5076)
MSYAVKRIEIPDKLNNNYREILSILLSDKDQKFIIDNKIWPDPAAWGLLLVDLVRNIGIAYGGSGDVLNDPHIARLMQGFDIEWQNPTDRIT